MNEISGDRAYENVRQLTHYHRIDRQQRLLRRQRVDLRGGEGRGPRGREAHPPEVRRPRLVVRAPARRGWCGASAESKLAAYGEVAVSIADNSRTTHVSAELVDVGAGDRGGGLRGQGREGQDRARRPAPLAAVHREAVWKRGALGVLSYQTHRPEAFDAPDQVAWGRMPYEAKGVAGVKDGTPATFAVMISPRRARLAAEAARRPAPSRSRWTSSARSRRSGEQASSRAGSGAREIHDQQIVLTAHIQERRRRQRRRQRLRQHCWRSARALTRLIKDGKIPRPRRDIRFWWVNEFASEERYFRENPQEPRKHAARTSTRTWSARGRACGGRVQYGSRLPWSLPHVLDDVMESVLGHGARRQHLAAHHPRHRACRVPFTREITAVKGSREPYHARMVPYYDSHRPPRLHAGAHRRAGDEPHQLARRVHPLHRRRPRADRRDPARAQRRGGCGRRLVLRQRRGRRRCRCSRRTRARAASRASPPTARPRSSCCSREPIVRAAYQAARNLIVHSARKERGAQASIPRLGGASPAPAFKALQVGSSAAIDRAEAAQLQSLDLAYATLGGQAGITGVVGRREGPGGAHLQPGRHHR